MSKTFRKTKLSSAVALSLVTALPYQSIAQENQDPAFEEIVVKGIRRALERGVDTKRVASGVVDSISAEGIGKFPDNNLAESLQRISGVSIDRSGGEGQSITVRGFGPEFNTVLLNGRQLASESDTRGFGFDTIAAEMVAGIDVAKTASASTQSGGVGSTVNIRTLRPFDAPGLKIAGSVKAQYESLSEDSSPSVSGVFSNTFADDTFGLLVAVSRQERDVQLNWAQTNGWLENVGVPQEQINDGAGFSGNTFTPRNFDLLQSRQERERTNANVVLQFRPNDDLEVSLDYLYSEFDVNDSTSSYGHWFTGSNLTDVTLDQNGTAIDLRQEVGLATDFHAKRFNRITETDALSLNLNWNVNDNLSLVFDAHTSSADRFEGADGNGDLLSLVGYANRVRFQSDGATLPWTSEFQAANPGVFSGQQELDGVAYQAGVDPAGVSDYLDPNNLRAHVMLRRGWAVEDEVDQFKFDGVWDNDTDQGLVKAKFGMMSSSETKSLTRWDNEGAGIHCTYCGYPDSPSVSGVNVQRLDGGGDFLSGVSGSGRTPAVWLSHNGEAQFAAVSAASGLNFDAVIRDNSFTVEEETNAFYGEFDFAGVISDMPIYMTAGARYEDTDVTVNGTEASITGLRILDRTEMLAQFGEARPINTSSNYSKLLPSLSTKLEINDNWVARFAASRTLTRPTLRDMAPVTVIGTTRQGGNLTSSSGNPELLPFESDNLDFSFEYYYGDVSYASIGYFRKDVNNFIVSGTEDLTFTLPDGSQLRDPSTGSNPDAPDANDGLAVFTNTLPSNGEAASVDGFELTVQHEFGDSGFGVIANATFVDTDSEFNPADITQKFAVTGLSDSLNLVGYFERGPFQARLAYNQRDEFLQSLTQLNGDGVQFVDEYSQWDLSASYDISDRLTVFFEGINLTEEVVTKHGRFSNHFLLAEDSGRRLSLGFRGNW